MRRRIPLDVKPEQRYLRSRQNRRARKVRRVRDALRVLWIVVAAAVLVGVAIRGGLGALRALETTPEFSLTQIEVTGNARITRQSIETRLAPWIGRSVLAIDLPAVEADLETEPWVLDAMVRRILPHTLCVTVRERVPAALAVVGVEVLLVDRTGHPIGPVGADAAESLPVLTGLDGKDPAKLRSLLERGVAAIDAIERAAPSFGHAVSEIDLSVPDRLALRTVDGGPAILLDPERVERNLSAFLDLRGEIERLVGRAAYVDLRWQDRIALKPLTQPSMGEDG
jgi:cell division protein FtsQ